MIDLYLQDFLVSYSLPTLIIASIVCAISLTLNKFFDKMPKLLKLYLPFLLAITLHCAYDMIFVLKAFTFTNESLYAGILSASLSVILSSSLKKIFQGKPFNTNKPILLIEGILERYISQSCLSQTAYIIEEILLNCQDETEQERQVENAIKDNGDESIVEEASHLTKLIIQAVSSIKRT